MTLLQLTARQEHLTEELREVDRLLLEERKRREKQEAQQGPHRFYYYEIPEGVNVYDYAEAETIPCGGCGKLRTHENHRADNEAFQRRCNG